MEGLRQNGVEVIECHDDSSGLTKYFKLFFKHWKIRRNYDAMVVGFLGQVIIPFAAFLNLPFISWRRRKPMIFDAFLSLYDSNVYGRQIVQPGSLKSLFYWLLDWISMRFGDIVLFDTQAHVEYIAKEFGIDPGRMAKIFVGAREDIFRPMAAPGNGDKFKVLFYGTFIRSQGIEYILEAAKILEKDKDVEFLIIGTGQVKKEMLALAEKLDLKNVKYKGFIPPAEIAENISMADVCLGLFGKPAKIQRVIPTKVYECVAMRKPVITINAPAIHELFDENDLALVKVADSEDLAGMIEKLKNDPNLRNQLAENCYRKYRQFASTKMIGAELIRLILNLKDFKPGD
jgi:glycosyltransferase involved in cell wall biosynthesis